MKQEGGELELAVVSPVGVADSAIVRADVGGTLIGCTNPLWR